MRKAAAAFFCFGVAQLIVDRRLQEATALVEDGTCCDVLSGPRAIQHAVARYATSTSGAPPARGSCSNSKRASDIPHPR
jgi:hypothetical protein